MFHSDLEDTSTFSIKEEPVIRSKLPVGLLAADSTATEKGCTSPERNPLIDDEAEKVTVEATKESAVSENDCKGNLRIQLN